MVTILGIKFKTGRTLKTPENEATLAYAKAAREGYEEAKKILNKVI